MSLRFPSVAIIVRVMDRAHELRSCLPSLLGQDYPCYSLVIVDHSSQDGIDSILAPFHGSRLRVVRCPRPDFFNRSRAANIGVRYSFSDLLFFMDTGFQFRDSEHLTGIVASFLAGNEVDYDYYRNWRSLSGYPPLEAPPPTEDANGRRVYCECHGLHLLERSVFQRLGGRNEALLDWGYEDTDISTRLELCGYGRIPIGELVQSEHADDHRIRFHREKSKERSWTRNRRISDGLIRTFGPMLKTKRFPGLCDWVEIDGVRYTGTQAPQQDWAIETLADLPRKPQSSCSPPVQSGETEPLISVVVPTKNAAEYLVGCLDSILSQEYPHVECVVMDGGSTDATLDILASYGNRISWTSQSDRGAFEAINRGWQKSRGEILAWLNADDSWTPGAAAAAVRSFQANPEADIIYGDCLIIDAEGGELEKREPPDWDLAYATEVCYHIIDQPAAFIRRPLAERVGWLYPDWFHDWDFWRRASLAGAKIKRVPLLLGRARVRVDNTQYRPEILVDGLVRAMNRFFSHPNLTADLRKLQPRALSNCYLRIVQTLQYGRPEARGLRFKLLAKALVADLTNLMNVVKVRPGGRLPAPTRSPSAGETSSGAAIEPGIALLQRVLATQPAEKPLSRQGHSPLISVVIPCKNDIRFLPYALESILSQDYPNLECIVADGVSTDGTLDLLQQCGDRITWLSQPDRGSFDAINRGWKLSQGDILAWLNADDLWEPGAARMAVDFLEKHPDVDVLYGNAGVIDEDGRVWGELVPPDWDLEFALRNCDHVIFQSASFIRRRILEQVGWLYPAWCHDHDLWLRIARAGGKFARLPTRLAWDRMRSANLGNLASIVVPAKIGLTQRFFDQAPLPPNLRQLKPRAMSNAYLRGVDYLAFERSKHWVVASQLLLQALLADPRNVKAIAERFSRPLRWRLRQLLRFH